MSSNTKVRAAPLITDDGSMEHVLRMFASEVADGLGALEVVPGTHHKFERVPGDCCCKTCGQGEVFAAHRPPQNGPGRRTLAEMNREWKAARLEVDNGSADQATPPKGKRTKSVDTV